MVMSGGWRLARSLEVLRDEIRALHPGTTVWTIGDAAHLATWSDHNPNAAGVVCAIDVLADGGLDLGWFAEQVRTSGHPAFKYVIFNRRIASKGGGWRPYHGSNPHTTHVHVSVGVGPDGRSTGPYDNTSPWGVAGQAAGGDPLSAEDVWRHRLPWANDWPVDRWGARKDGYLAQTYLSQGYALTRRVDEGVREVLAGQAAILAAIAGRDPVEAMRGELDRHRALMLAEVRGGLDELAELVRQRDTGELTAEQVVDELARRLAGTEDTA